MVDDHPLVHEGLARALARSESLRIVGAATTRSTALEAVARLQPDLVLLDLRLGCDDGLLLLPVIKASAPETRVLVLSMLDERLYAERALRAGAVGYVNKDEPVDALRAAIELVMTGNIRLPSSTTQHLMWKLMGRHRAEPQADPLECLSDRALQILELIGRGIATRTIASTLGVSAKTVATHRDHIREKLGIESLSALVRFAVVYVERGSLGSAGPSTLAGSREAVD